MTKLLMTIICAATLIMSKATAQEANADPAVTGSKDTAVVAQELDLVAVQAALLCKTQNTCGALTNDDRAKAALALLFLRISENCAQRPCALRLARAR